MRGIDISNWQSGIELNKLDIDFCICKATEGLTFVDPYCDSFVQELIKLNKCWGFYHFAGNGNPYDEAKFFYESCKNYFNHGIPVLDYEITNDNDMNWIESFVSKLYNLSGVYCMIYMSASWCNKLCNSWVPSKCGLWVAGYPIPYTTWINSSIPYDISPWEFAAIWQFTSSLIIPGFWQKLDGNIAYMDKTAWNKYACCKENNDKEKPKKSYSDIAFEIILGEYGNNEDRKRMLEEMGYDYNKAQELVNLYYYLADEVIQGKWGNGWNRKNALTGAGYNYDAIQYIVNSILE